MLRNSFHSEVKNLRKTQSKKNFVFPTILFLGILFFSFILFPQKSLAEPPLSFSSNSVTESKLPNNVFSLKVINEFKYSLKQKYNALKDRFIKLKKLFYFNFLHSSPVESVVIGKDNWLFFTGEQSLLDYQGKASFSADEIQKIQANLEKWHNWCEKRNKKFIVVFGPDKHTIYPEFLPDSIRLNKGQTRIDQIMSHLKTQNSQVLMLDLRKTLLAAKKDKLLYSLTDTHWNDYASFLAYQEIMRNIQKFHPDVQPKNFSDFQLDYDKNYAGDLAQMIGPDIYLYRDDRIILKPKSPLSAVNKPLNYDFEIDGLYNKAASPLESAFSRETIASNQTLKAVMFRDSFSNFIAVPLSENFKKITYIWSYNIDERVLEAEDPDIVIYEFVERCSRHLLNL